MYVEVGPAASPQSTQVVLIHKEREGRDFPGGSVVKIPDSQCRRPGFDPRSGTKIPHATTKSSNAATKDPICLSQINKY